MQQWKNKGCIWPSQQSFGDWWHLSPSMLLPTDPSIQRFRRVQKTNFATAINFKDIESWNCCCKVMNQCMFFKFRSANRSHKFHLLRKKQNCMHNDHGNLSSQRKEGAKLTCVRLVDISFTLSNTKFNYNGVSLEWILNAATGDLYIYISCQRQAWVHACMCRVWLEVWVQCLSGSCFSLLCFTGLKWILWSILLLLHWAAWHRSAWLLHAMDSHCSFSSMWW